MKFNHVLSRPRQFTVNQSVARNEAKLFARCNALKPKFSAGTFKNQSASGDVPKIDAALDVGVKASSGHIGQTQRGRTHHADFSHAA
jgi:hypothetical protein